MIIKVADCWSLQEFINIEKWKNQEIKNYLARQIPKNEIAKIMHVTPYEVSKVENGVHEDIVFIHFFTPYRKIAKKMYWELEFNKFLTKEDMANKYQLKMWMVEELLKLFKQYKDQGLVPKRK